MKNEIEKAVLAERARCDAILKKRATDCTRKARTFPIGDPCGICQDIVACELEVAEQEINGGERPS